MKFILQKRGRTICRVFQNVDIIANSITNLLQTYVELLLDDLQDLHGASLDTDAAGDTLSGRTVFGSDHNLHGANLNALAAGGTELLVDHVNTGLGILGDSTSLTDLCALTALDADHRLCFALLLYDLDAGQILMELLIESGGTCVNTLQACHALAALFNTKLLHSKVSPLLNIIISVILYKAFPKIATIIFRIS